MTKQNADSARQADGLMSEARQIVDKANASMGQLKQAMDKINRASDETAKIIKTIDEIAFQTNLLALNAAVGGGPGRRGRSRVRGGGRRGTLPGHARGRGGQEHPGPDRRQTFTTFRTAMRWSPAPTRPSARSPSARPRWPSWWERSRRPAARQAQGIDQVNQATGEMDKVTQQVAANAEESARRCRGTERPVRIHEGYRERSGDSGGRGRAGPWPLPAPPLPRQAAAPGARGAVPVIALARLRQENRRSGDTPGGGRLQGLLGRRKPAPRASRRAGGGPIPFPALAGAGQPP